MKKAPYIFGLLAVITLSLLLTGWVNFDEAAPQALRAGNRLYALAQYEAALATYETGLEIHPDDEVLNFNAAQAAMELGEFEKAAQYYELAADNADKYLNAGNIYYAVGNAVEETDAKVQFYAKALLIYQEGIVLYPQNVPLKFNYEFVKALLDEENQSEDSGEGDKQEGDEDSEQRDGEASEQDSSEQDSSEQNSNEESQGQEGEEQADTQDEEAPDLNEEENMQEQGAEGEEENEDALSAGEEEYEADMEAIQRILEILESQEEESLKNNQNVMQGKDGKIDW